MLALAIFAVVGAVIGAFAVLLWASIDALFGFSSLNDDRMFGVVGLSIVVTEIVCWGVIAYEEFRS